MPVDTGETMLGLIKSAISVSTLMASIRGQFGDLFSAVLVGTSEYIVDEARRHNESPEKFLDYFTTSLKECVDDVQKMERESDSNAN